MWNFLARLKQTIGVGNAHGSDTNRGLDHDGGQPEYTTEKKKNHTSIPAPRDDDLTAQGDALQRKVLALEETISSVITASPSLTAMGLLQEVVIIVSETQTHVKKHKLFQDCVDRLVGADAHAAYLTSAESFRRSDDITKDIIWDFMERYKKIQQSNLPRLSLRQQVVRPEDRPHLLSIYDSVIELAHQYAEWALAVPGPSEAAVYPLSNTEMKRIHRAMYRLETFYNLCSARSPCQMHDSLDRARILSTFQAWEVEEMLSIYEWAKLQVSSALQKVVPELMTAFEPHGKSLLDEDGVIAGHISDYVLSCGLQQLHTIIKTDDKDQLLETFLACLAYTPIPPDDTIDSWLDVRNPDSAVSKRVQQQRRANWPTDADAAQDRGEKLTFEDDTPDKPNMAWVLYWDERASNLFGEHVPPSFRRRGFAMWDVDRLDAGTRLWIQCQAPAWS